MPPTDQKQEQEVKIQPQANLQFKYTNIATPEAFARQAEALLAIIGLKGQAKGTRTLVDNYYDFDDFRLQNAGYSLRMRRGEADSGLCNITLKHQSANLSARGMQRDEMELEIPEKKGGSDDKHSWENLIARPEMLFAQLLPNSQLPTKGTLIYLGSVHNDRSRVDFTTRMASWRMSYDRYYYFKGQYDDSSEFTRYFSEVEVELLNGEPTAFESDDQLSQVVGAFVKLFGMEESRTTKLQRGMQCQWGSKPEIAHVYVLGLDIVAYSKRVPELQLQLIQKLNKWMKDSLAAARVARGVSPLDKFTVYIPTGDGMYLVFDRPEDAMLIPDVLARVSQKAKDYNSIIVGDEKTIHCRYGLHAGPVFKYSDINEELNFAGNGLNIAARVLSRADSDQVLLSTPAKEFFETYAANKKRMELLGELEVKHELAVGMWNYFDEDNGVGIQHYTARQILHG